MDTRPQRHGGDSSGSMWRGCKPAEKCNRIELRLRVVVRGCIWVISRVSERVRPPSRAIQVLRNADGCGGVSTFLEKSVTKV